jgi:hypothetical protein
MLWTETESANNNLVESPLNSNLIPSTDPLQASALPGKQLTTGQTIAFVDSSVSDAMTLMADLQADIKVFLDPTRDGIAQITETLAQYQGLSGINIISHGNVAELQLGNSFLNANSLGQYSRELTQWGSSLTADGDILFHGCNVAAGELGQAFVNDVSALTGADVAASTDLTGNAALGGDWTLEYATGNIESENAVTDSLMNSYQGLLPSLFTTQTPADFKTDGTGSAGDYELGMEFRSARAGTISAIRYYKAPNETGTHVGRIWSSTGQLLASVNFTNETASGWQEQALTTPLSIQANTTYVVSVNANTFYAFTSNGITTTITNGDLSAVADGSNGVFNTTPSAFPTQSFQNSNYFRDIVFTANPSPNNNPGTVTINGTKVQGSTLTANVSDADGLTGATINYQWQQSSDNGTNWNNIAGATSQTLTLGQAQVNNLVRARAIYTDALGSGENITSTATSSVANVNDAGSVAISGTTAQGNTLTANVTDVDGLTGVNINYQWQKLTNNTWTNITGATNQTLTLDSSLVGNQVRVNSTYTDVLGGSENIVSTATNPISLPANTLFTTQTPAQNNETDGSGSAGDYELGMEFRSAKAGQIKSIRYYKAPSETGTHVGRIWSSTGTLLASVTFANETASGWQQQALTTPLTIQANTTYVVSVNANSYYVATNNGLATTITNGDLSAIADGSNGVYNPTPSSFPTQSFQNSNYFRDIVFTASTPNPNNNPGTVTVAGQSTEDQTLTANVSDADGLNGVTINYQWQQSSDNGTTWNNIVGATSQTLTLGDAQVNKRVRVRANYVDTLGSSENLISAGTSSVANINDLGLAILAGSATSGATLKTNILDTDGLTGVIINYQWQQFANNIWTNIAGATAKSLTLGASLLGQQVRATASYIDALGSSENIFTLGTNIAAQNAIVLENQKTGTTAWQITNLATNNEIAGYGDATSINKGQALNLKVSLAQAGQYRIDVYRLGYYGGTGGRLLASVTGLNGVTQAGPTITNVNTNLIEYKWNTSYTLQTGTDWTTGLYQVKLTDSRTGKQTYIPFVVRDDNRPTDLGFQDAVTTAQAYNNYGGYSVYDVNSTGGQRAYQVSFDRPYAAAHLGLTNTDGFNSNNMLAWEYNMTRWLESQGYDVSYYTNLDVSTNPLQLYSQKTFLSVGHDEYWSMEQRNNVQQARDNGTNLAFFSANTAYWQVRFDPSSSGQANRVMTIYKDSSGIGTNPSIDPIAQTNPSAATTLFRSSEVNRPENALLGVGYVGDSGNIYGGYDFVVSNASDPYYANTGLKNGDRLTGLVGYEWDALLNNGLTPPGLVVLSQSPVPSIGLGGLGLLPPGTNDTISNAVRYTASSGAKVFSTGSIQWVWGLDSSNVTNPRVDRRAQQITVNVLKDMGTIPQTPDAGIVVV